MSAATIALSALPSMLNSDHLPTNPPPSPPHISSVDYYVDSDGTEDNNSTNHTNADEIDDSAVAADQASHDSTSLVERPSMLSDRPSMLSEPTFVARPTSMLGDGSEDLRGDPEDDDSSSHDGTTNNVAKVPYKRGKRKKYQKYTPEDRIAIGKYCFEHGPAAARKAFQDRYPEMSESVTRGFRDKYKQMIGESAVYEFEQKRQKELQNSYSAPPRGRPRKYKIIDESNKPYEGQTSPPPPSQAIKDEYARYHPRNGERLPFIRENAHQRPVFAEAEKDHPRIMKITLEDQLKIGRYCSHHGVMKALQEFHKEYPGISESIIFDFHKQYQRHKQEQDHHQRRAGYRSPPNTHAHEYPTQPQVFVLEGDHQMAEPGTTGAARTNGVVSPRGEAEEQASNHSSPPVSPKQHQPEERRFSVSPKQNQPEERRFSPYARSSRSESRSPPYRSFEHTSQKEEGRERHRSRSPSRHRSRSPPHHRSPPMRSSPNIQHSTISSHPSVVAPPIIHYPRPRPHSPRHHSPPNFNGHLHRSVSENTRLREFDVIPPRINGYAGAVEYPYDRKDLIGKPIIGTLNPQSGRSKRFKYQKYTPEDRYNIGKLCNDIGLGATVKVYREQFPRLNESVVRTFRNKYRELLEKGGGIPATEAIERKPSRRSISTLIEGEVVSQLKQFHSSQIELSENFVIAVAENVIATKHHKEAENIKGIITKEWANSLLWKHKLLDKPSGNVQGVCCERCKTILVCPKCPN